jgi:protein involved in polysaccharide export with SLBB domain
MSIRTHRATLALGSMLVIAAALAGCSSSSQTQAPTAFVMPAQPQQEPTEYIIQPGDSLDVSFYFHPDNNQQNLLVRPDGKIYLPVIGEVQAGGLTAPQLAESIQKRSSVTLRDPKVAINIRTMNQTRIFVGGEVARPGFVNYSPGMTAVQALMQVGGWKDSADLKEVVLLQKVADTGNEYRPTKIDLQRVINDGEVKSDIVLNPSDIIVLPKTGIAKANLWMQQYVINMIPIRISASPF